MQKTGACLPIDFTHCSKALLVDTVFIAHTTLNTPGDKGGIFLYGETLIKE
ncbi:hypothetical protein NHG25_03990 [Aerococcaceae bacterium NML191292]|nr:hypothetical protein [Aerococcaceae bacterium NML191292]MCW6682102.1 hypothetical protein [Aerococcaceae bacterium NML160702]